MKKKYKISTDSIQNEWIEKIIKAGRTVIWFDDTAVAKIKGTWEEIPIDIFNQLDFIGIIRFKRDIGSGVCEWRVNQNIEWKLKENDANKTEMSQM